MKVMANSLHLVDYQTSGLKKINIPEDIPDFIQDLIEHIRKNKSVKYFKTRSNDTQVVSNVFSLIEKLSTDKSIKENDTSDVEEIFEKIAYHLLLVEQKVQDKIEPMGQNVKKGSLIQAAVIFEELNQYAYFIAKVNHKDFIDDTDFLLKTGFLKQEKFWKSCMFDISKNDVDIVIDEAKIYLDNVAKYWSDDFLELDEFSSDESNTKNAYKFINSVLIQNVKRNAPSDYWVIRNNVIGYMKSGRQISYIDMVNDIFTGYFPIELTNDDLKKVKSKLLDDSKWKFDPMFESIPSIIQAKIKSVFPITRGIELSIKEEIPDIRNDIKSIEDGGKRYLKIHVTDDKTFEAFKRK